jgi:hypothetical protein
MASLTKELNRDLGVSIYEEGHQSVESYLYGQGRNVEVSKDNLNFQAVKYLEVGDVKWVIEMYSLPIFEKRFVESGNFSIFVGVVLSCNPPIFSHS